MRNNAIAQVIFYTYCVLPLVKRFFRCIVAPYFDRRNLLIYVSAHYFCSLSNALLAECCATAIALLPVNAHCKAKGKDRQKKQESGRDGE